MEVEHWKRYRGIFTRYPYQTPNAIFAIPRVRAWAIMSRIKRGTTQTFI